MVSHDTPPLKVHFKTLNYPTLIFVKLILCSIFRTVCFPIQMTIIYFYLLSKSWNCLHMILNVHSRALVFLVPSLLRQLARDGVRDLFSGKGASAIKLFRQARWWYTDLGVAVRSEFKRNMLSVILFLLNSCLIVDRSEETRPIRLKEN